MHAIPFVVGNCSKEKSLNKKAFIQNMKKNQDLVGFTLKTLKGCLKF